jgi:uncharacterized peroxidase-related enzyme
MNRLGQVDPATVTGPVREIFDGPLKGKHFNIFKSMGHSHAALQMYLAMNGALAHSTLSPAEKEVIQLTVGEANNCQYCVAAHTAIGKMSGLSTEQTVEARRGAMSDAKLNALARFALAIHETNGFVSDQDLAQFKAAGYTHAQVAEVVAVYALAIYTNTFNHVNDTVSDFPAAPRI